MSIAGPQPLAPYTLPQARLTPGYAPAGGYALGQQNQQQYSPGFTLDQFQRRQTAPIIRLTQKQKSTLVALHPFEFRKFQQRGALATANEGLYETLFMYDKVYRVLNPFNRGQLKKLLKQGVLQNTKAEDGHSALFHLYGMLNTRRAQGYDPKVLVNETVDILNRPYAITQKFAPLSEEATQKILMARNYPESNRAGVMPPSKLLTRADLNVEESGTCVASSVMYYMADREPAELARHLNEMTSPLNGFFEKVRFEEISPENPADALRILKENQVSFQISGPNEATVKVNLPPAGALRAIDSQFAPLDHRYRNAIETAYQSALTFLANHAYDPAIDKEDAGPDEENRKGLTEPEKSLMETIVKENGGVQSVTYQAVDSKANPAPGEESNSYLYGYNRSFEQITNDIKQSLAMKEPVIIGTTDTDETGAIVTGHEITITGAYNDTVDGQLKFIVADSDDENPKLVVKSASELIPTIHHAGLPLHLAQRINQEVSSVPGVMVPDSQDANNFKLLSRHEGPMPSMTPEPVAAFPQPAPLVATPPMGMPANIIPTTPVPAMGNPWSSFNPTVSQAAYAPNSVPARYTPMINPIPTNPFVFAPMPIAARA